MPERTERSLHANTAEMTFNAGMIDGRPVVQVVCELTYFDGKDFRVQSCKVDAPAGHLADQVANAYAMQIERSAHVD